MYIFNKIDCTECKGNMSLTNVDLKNKTALYKCSCNHCSSFSFDLVGGNSNFEGFALSESGELKCTCADCGEVVESQLTDDSKTNEELIRFANNCVCKKCNS